MPSQSEIAALKLKMQNAKSAMESASSSMKTAHDTLSRCVCGKRGAGCGSGCSGPYNSDKFPDLGDPATDVCAYQGTLGSAGKCCTDCCDTQTCETKRSAYNSAVTTYDKKSEEYDQAREDYETASGQSVDTNISKLESEAKAIRTRYIIFGIIVLALIGAAVFFIFKTKK